MKPSFWHYVDQKTLSLLVALIVLQQTLTAFGTYALAKAGFEITSPNLFLIWILISLAVHLLSPGFGLLIRPLEIRLTFKAYRRFLEENLISKSGTPSIWAQKSRKEVFLASIGSETDAYLGALIYVGLDVFSYLLSLLLGVLVLGFVIDKTLIPAFFLAGILSFLTYRLLEKYVKAANIAEQDGRTALASFLLLSWENIFFKNRSIIQTYHEGFEIKFAACQQRSVESVRWSEVLVFLLSTVSSLPVMITLFWVAQKHLMSVTLLTALLATLPRQLNLLMTFRSIFQSTASFLSFEAKFQTLHKNAELQAEELSPRIRGDQIQMHSLTTGEMLYVHDLGSLSASIQTTTSGRWVVRGPNGVGKSTLLLYLNTHLSSSYYLPAHPQFWLDEETPNESTGQKLIRHLRAIIQTDAKYVLLDEWDANLDEPNIRLAEELLSTLSRERSVIEVRHRSVKT